MPLVYSIAVTLVLLYSEFAMFLYPEVQCA